MKYKLLCTKEMILQVKDQQPDFLSFPFTPENETDYFVKVYNDSLADFLLKNKLVSV